MKSTSAQSATSLPRSPRDEVGHRSARYLIMMGVRVVCFLLMVLVQPFGWYTWVFGLAAVFLPYIAVVLANVGQEGRTVNAVNPEHALDAQPTEHPPEHPDVIRISEGPHAVAAQPTGAQESAASPSAADAPQGDDAGPDDSAPAAGTAE